MNRENLDRLIAALEMAGPQRFDMRQYFANSKGPLFSGKAIPLFQKDCGTAACIAGWVSVLAEHERTVLVACCEWLGISEDQGNELFMPHGYFIRERFPLSRALRTLYHLRDTGEVLWQPLTPGDL